MPAEFQKNHRENIVRSHEHIQLPGWHYNSYRMWLKDHKEKLFKCLDSLNEENLAINLNKCYIAKKKIKWLGYNSDQQGIQPIISKTQAMLNLKPPTSHRQLISFLGGVLNLKKFHDKFSILMSGIQKLTTKRHEIRMDRPPPNNVRKHKKVHLKNTHYDTKRKTRVKTDASRSG